MANKNGVNIPIGVTLDLSEVTKDAQTMSDKISDALSKHKDTQNPQIANAIKNLEKLQDKIIAIEAAREKMTSGSDNYQKLKELEERWTRTYEKTKQAEEAYKDYLTSIGKGNLVKNFDKYTASGIDKAYFGKNRTAEITEYIEKLKELSKASSEARREMLSIQGKAWNAAPNALTEEEMRQLAVLYKDATDSAGVYLLKVNEVEAKTQELGKETGKTGNSFKSNFYLARTILRDISKDLQKATDRVKNFVRHISNAAKHMLTLHKSSHSTTRTLIDGFKHALKNLMRYVFGIRSLYFLFRRLRGYVKETLQEMAKAFPEVNAQMSRAVTALNQMKASLGTAFQPLLNVLVPLLEKVAALVVKIANALGSLFAMLTGQKTIYSAVAVQTDYAESLDKTGASAKKAKKELEGYLSPIDEINKYQTNKDNDSGGGADGGGLAFEEVPIDPAMLDLFDRLKKMWDNSNFYELGKEIGTKLRDVLESIPWDLIRDTARRLGVSFATLINGFVEVERLGFDIGATIAQSLNTVFEAINGFVHSLKWASVGKFIADTFNGFFETIDWPLIEDTVITGFKGLATAISSFVQNFHWDNISTFISNAVNTLVKGISQLFVTPDKLDLKDKGYASSIENYVSPYINWKELGSKIGTQIQKSIEEIDWEAMGELVGGLIHSMIEFAVGLLKDKGWSETARKAISDFITGLFSQLTTEDKEAIANVLATLLIGAVTSAVAKAAAKLAGMKLMASFVGKIFGGSGAGGGAAAGTSLAAPFTYLLGVLSLVISAFGLVQTWLGTIREGFSLTREEFMFGFNQVLGVVFKGFGTAGFVFQNFVLLIIRNWDTIEEKLESFKEKWNIFKDKLKNDWEDIKKWFKKLLDDIINYIKGTFTGSWTTNWNNLKTIFKDVWNGIISIVESAINYIVDGLNAISFDVPDWAPVGGGKHFGFSLSRVSLPKLAQGAVLPPNREFMAVLGDQKQGTNIETPIDTMIEAFNAALSQNGGSGRTEINFLLPDRRKIAQYVLEGGRIMQTSTGKNPFELA